MNRKAKRFEAGLAEWMKDNKFIVGADLNEATMQRKQVSSQIGWVTKILGLFVDIPLNIQASNWLDSHKGSQSQIQDAMNELAKSCDFFGTRLMDGKVIAVIYGDKITIEQLSGLLNDLQKTAKTFSNILPSSVACWMTPVIVFFNSGKHDLVLAELFPAGWHSSFWEKTYVQLGIVDCERKDVRYCKSRGIVGFGQGIVLKIVQFFKNKRIYVLMRDALRKLYNSEMRSILTREDIERFTR